MRCLTTIEGKNQAEVFVAYLLTLDVSTHVEPAQSESLAGAADAQGSPTDPSKQLWEVWVRNEDRMSLAQVALTEFQSNPNDPKYAAALKQANSILKEKLQEAKARQGNIKTTRDLSRNSLVGGKTPPLTLTLLILCCVLSLLSSFSQPEPQNRLGNSIVKQLKFVDMNRFNETKDPAVSIKKGEWWRVFTPAFLHGDPFHLLMNMFALFSLGGLVERLEGTRRYAWIVLLLAIGSHLPQGLLKENIWNIQGLSGSPNFVGISGVIMGLFGYIAMKTYLRPELGFSLSPQSFFMVGIILVLGFAGDIAGSVGNLHMANFAHLGGLLSGLLLGWLMSVNANNRIASR
jgi:GlpG protein